jgi:hypothetical protein
MIKSIPPQAKRLFLLFALVFFIIDALFFGLISRGFSRLTHTVGSPSFQGRTHLYSSLPGRPRAPQRIAIVTHYSPDGYGQELRRLTWGNKKKYAQARGYDIYDAETNPVIKAKLGSVREKMHNFYFFKYLAVQELLGGGEATGGKQYDWVVWVDADAIFLNFGKRFEDIIDERFDVIVTAGPPDNPTWNGVVNAGSFMVRNSEFSQTFLEDVMSMSQSHCGEFVIEYPEAGTAVNGWLQVCNPDGGYWLSDQGILIALYMFKPAEYRCHFKKLWFRAFSSEFPWYGPGDLAVHFPGRSMEDRRRLIKAFTKFSDFKTGAVEYKFTDILDPDDSITSDLVELEDFYKEVNPTCDAL